MVNSALFKNFLLHSCTLTIWFSSTKSNFQRYFSWNKIFNDKKNIFTVYFDQFSTNTGTFRHIKFNRNTFYARSKEMKIKKEDAT